jgi:hypothetical protein
MRRGGGIKEVLDAGEQDQQHIEGTMMLSIPVRGWEMLISTDRRPYEADGR